MHLQLLSVALAASSVTATPLNTRQSSPKVYLAGDSTMARTNSPLNGWGEYLSKYITLPVVNKAISGRSARSYTNEGRFTEIEKLVVANDIVVIAFGHNDGGSPNSASDNGRSACPGTGSEVCTSGKTGEKVYTYNYYMEQATRKLIAKGAKVVISSQTTKNPWQNGVWSGNSAPPRFVDYAKNAARNVGGNNVGFVDHYQSVVKAYQRLGSAAVNAFYPQDYTHTSPAGADVVAQAFVQAVARDFNGTTALKSYVKNPAPSVCDIVESCWARPALMPTKGKEKGSKRFNRSEHKVKSMTNVSKPPTPEPASYIIGGCVPGRSRNQDVNASQMKWCCKLWFYADISADQSRLHGQSTAMITVKIDMLLMLLLLLLLLMMMLPNRQVLRLQYVFNSETGQDTENADPSAMASVVPDHAVGVR
ncbi:SGNH hydrolase-type esterase domain-containing protein [Cladorrhinum sp. PSN259]|nr:SGNH hydrolase-type esterase domain-containing protein [Cladorrhinum sp. PSN259]